MSAWFANLDGFFFFYYLVFLHVVGGCWCQPRWLLVSA